MKPEQKDRQNKAAAAAPGNHLFADAKKRIPARALKNRTTRVLRLKQDRYVHAGLILLCVVGIISNAADMYSTHK